MGRYRARDLMSVPGLLSLARIPLAVLFPLAVDHPTAAIVVLLASGLTDVLDGWYARRFGQTTPTGAVVDALTDKLFVGAVVVTFLAFSRLTVIQAVLLSTREIGELPLVLWLAFGRSERRRGPGQLQANLAGKLSTCMQFITIGSVLLGFRYMFLLLLITAVMGAVSAALYWIREFFAPRAGNGYPR